MRCFDRGKPTATPISLRVLVDMAVRNTADPC